jgi:hypothetical protein
MNKLVLGLMLIAGIVAAQTPTTFTSLRVTGNAEVVGDLKVGGESVAEKYAELVDYLADGLLVNGALAVDTDESEFATEAVAYYRIGGVQYTKAASTGLTFTAADTINVAESTNSVFYGAWLVQINGAGTVSTKPAGGLTNQVYTTLAAATAAIPAPTAANVALGSILIASPAGTAFVANTTDMTTNIVTIVDAPIKVLPSKIE